MISGTLTTPRGLATCDVTRDSGDAFMAPDVNDWQDPQVSILASDKRICLDLQYVGMAPASGTECPTVDKPCIPFSGQLQAKAFRKTLGYEVLVEARRAHSWWSVDAVGKSAVGQAPRTSASPSGSRVFAM